MKFIAFTFCLAVSAYCQSKGPPPPTQSATGCAQNFGPGSSNNTGTITCSGVDKKLADQISQLVAAAKRDGKTLKEISDKIGVLLREVQGRTTGGLSQSNSGGINVQQGTTGSNSPIVNSPVIIGNLPKSIQPQDLEVLKTYFRNASAKAKVQIWADQISGANPFPDDLYDAFKGGGWTMADGGVIRFTGYSAPGRPFQGAIVTTHGDPITASQPVLTGASDPLTFIGNALDAFKIPSILRRDPKQEDGLVIISLEGGFSR